MSVHDATLRQRAPRARPTRRRVTTTRASGRPQGRAGLSGPPRDSRRGLARLARPVARRTESDATTLRLLAELLESGLPLSQSLSTFERAAATQASSRRASIVGGLVRSGMPLSQALGTVGSRPAVVAILAASERVGRLGEGLTAAADLLEHLAGVRRGVRSAMVYPAVIAALGLGIVLVISAVVLPQFQRSFAALGADLPPATRVLLEVGRLFGRIASPRGAVMLVVALVLTQAFRSARRRDGAIALSTSAWARQMRRPFQAMTAQMAPFSRLPIVGRVKTEVDLVIASRIMATMLDGGAVVDDALQAAGAGMSTPNVRACFEAAHTALLAGNVESMLIELGAVLTPSEVEMLTVGHERGLSNVQWRRIARRRAHDLDELLRRLVSLTEPLLVVAVGLVVGAAVSALYLPTFRILDAL